MAKDVATFLNWAAEPEFDERKKIGVKAVIIFSSLFAISIWVKRFKWSVIKSRKIGLCFLSFFEIAFAYRRVSLQSTKVKLLDPAYINHNQCLLLHRI